jgi:hypothetical protein
MATGLHKRIPRTLTSPIAKSCPTKWFNGTPRVTKLPRFAGRQSNLVFAHGRFDGFSLDEGQLEIRLRLKESALLQEVAIALQAGPGHGLYRVYCLGGRLCRRRDVD